MPPRSALARSQSSKPCKLCNNLDPRSHPATYQDQESTTRSIARLTLQLDPVRLKRSGEVCPRCRLLAQALDAHFESWRKAKPRLLLDLVECAPLRLDVQDGKCTVESIEIYAPDDKTLPWPTLGHAQSVPKRSDSDDSFDFAERAIEDCIKNHHHRLCGQSRRDEFVPTRLIYVGKSPGATNHIKLCQLPANKVKYITLSHCWGGGPKFTTTSANLDERKRHINFSSMPQSFQDAVIITQELGIHYLWIDALCIIQDSKEDWELESAKMSSVYENAYLTIAATAAPNSDAGIFSARPRTTKLKYQASPRTKEYKLCARKVPDHHSSATSSSTKHASSTPTPPSGPLRTRAWALQEHVLCSRILHYTAHELFFECRLTARCECRVPSRKLPQATTPRLLPQLLITGKKDAYWRTWHAIVRQYTARQLTVPADKLPAISGIARGLLTGMGGAGAGAYVAGLWRGNLVGDLLWTMTMSGVDGVKARPEVWRAPSWSWASVDGEVSYEWAAGTAAAAAAEGEEREAMTVMVEVRDVHVRPSGRNPLGAVGEAWVRLVGPVVDDVVLVAGKADDDGGGDGENDGGIRYRLRRAGRGGAIDVVPDTLLVATADDTDSQNMIARRAKPGEGSVEFKTHVVCLGLARYESSWIAGIVLGVSERKGKRGYERLGLFGCGDEWFAGAEKKEVVLL